MATHESWQFVRVQEHPDDHIPTLNITKDAPLSVESSQLPIGTTLFDTNPYPLVASFHPNLLTISGPHNIIRARYLNPSQVTRAEYNEFPSGYDLYSVSGLKILRKTKEFPRDFSDSSAVTVFQQFIHSFSTTSDYEDFLIVDNFDEDQIGQTWYYTAFYVLQASDNPPTSVDTFYIYSPLHSHDRAVVLSPSQSTSGLDLYNYFPGRVQNIDQEEQSGLLKSLMDILGRPLDEISLKTDKSFSEAYSPSEVDAAMLPYIDHLLGWPTNFELGELKRRRETESAVLLWRSKGTKTALEGALQQIIGWDVEIYDGYDHVLRVYDSADEPLDPNSAPSNWNPSTDGVWADLVNSVPANTTVDLSDPANNPVILEGDINDNVKVIADFSSWKNPYGVLIRVSNPSSTALSQSLMEEKIDRLTEYLMIAYAIPFVKVITP